MLFGSRVPAVLTIPIPCRIVYLENFAVNYTDPIYLVNFVVNYFDWVTTRFTM